jgi:thiol-disulfide isomerase/thioredoxin
MSHYNEKYLKYKTKYLNLKKSISLKGGSNKSELYLIKADWCGHCKMFKPTWAELQNKVKSVDYVTLDADKDKTEIEKYGIQGYPTILLKSKQQVIEYNGSRDYNSLVDFIQQYNKN